MHEVRLEPNIFDLIPNNFFSVFSSKDRRENFILLKNINDYLNNSSIGIRVEKEELVFNLTNYLENHPNFELTDENDEILKTKTLRDKILYKIRQFIKSGWLVEEHDKDDLYISFTGNGIEVYRVLENLIITEAQPIEYSGYTFTIFSLLKQYNSSNAISTLEQINKSSNELKDKLKTLNNKIRVYLEDLIKQEDLKPEDVLDIVFKKYQEKVVLTAFNNLKTKDYPAKYSNFIITSLEKLKEPFEFSKIVDNYISIKKVSIITAKDHEEVENKVLTLIDDVIYFYREIDNMINDIDDKNNRYLLNAKAILSFMLNNTKDIEADINNLIKAVGKLNDEEEFDIFNLYLIQNVDNDSLYSPRFNKEKITSTTLVSYQISEEEIKEANQKLEINYEFLKKGIFAFINNLLKDKDELSLKDLEVDDQNTLIKLSLAFAYSSANEAKYEIELQNELINKNGYTMQNFIIRKKGVNYAKS